MTLFLFMAVVRHFYVCVWPFTYTTVCNVLFLCSLLYSVYAHNAACVLNCTQWTWPLTAYVHTVHTTTGGHVFRCRSVCLVYLQTHLLQGSLFLVGLESFLQILSVSLTPRLLLIDFATDWFFDFSILQSPMIFKWTQFRGALLTET